MAGKSIFTVWTLFLTVCLSSILVLAAQSSDIISAYVVSRGDQFQVVEDKTVPVFEKLGGDNPLIEASGQYEKNVSGWAFLSIATSLPVSIDDQIVKFRAAGIVEGYLTCTELKQSYPNFYADNFGRDLPSEDLLNFIIENYQWMRSESEKQYRASSYWLATKSSLEQLHGVVEGYLNSPCNRRRDRDVVLIDQHASQEWETTIAKQLRAQMAHVNDVEQLGLLHLLLMNAWGDLYTIMTKLSLNTTLTAATATATHSQPLSASSASGDTDAALEDFIAHRKRIFHPHSQVERDLRCSSLFKMLPNYEDIVFGHATWASFIALGPRTFKYYSLPSASVSVDRYSVELRGNYFSSSPGILASLDDFYVVCEVCTYVLMYVCILSICTY